MRPVITRLLLFAGLAIVALVVIAALQRKLIYYPERAAESHLLSLAERQEILPWRDAGGELIGWRFGSPDPSHRLLIFHGNAGYALYRVYYEKILPPSWEAFVMEYPGYGARPGSPTETSLKKAAQDALDLLRQDASEVPLHLAGESLGTGVAAWLAGQNPKAVKGVLLITPMTSLVDVGAHHYPFLPVRWLMADRFDSVTALASYDGPAAFVLAGRDEVIPVELGRRLHETYPGPKRLLEQPGAGHNTLELDPTWWRPAFEFLDSTPHGG